MSRLYVPTLDDPPLQAVLWRHRQDPWRPMVACMLLNMTSRRQVDEVWPELFDRWPTARDMADGDPLRQADVLDPLGLHFRVVQAWRELVRDCGVCLCPRCGVWAPPGHQFAHPSATAVAQ